MDGDKSDTTTEFLHENVPSTSVPMCSSDIIAEAVTNINGDLGSTTLNLLKKLGVEEKRRFFDVDGCVQWIKSKGFKRIALQFPDYMLPFASQVIYWLEQEINATMFILADTSYRSCCVDDIAAEHANADSIIHYGEACLSEYSSRFPVRYVFGNYSVDTKSFSNAIESNRTRLTSNCVLLYDVAYTNFIEANYESSINLLIPNLINAIPSTTNVAPTASGDIISLGRKIPENFADLSNVTVVFMGSDDSPLLTLWLMTHTNCTNVLSYDACSGCHCFFPSNSLRQLKKRLFLIEKLKDAATIGAVVCSLGISGYVEATNRLATLCANANKKFYVISVGKLNVAKLSNFATDIDAFVIISCPFGIILNTADFYSPVVSFFEAEFALNPAKEPFVLNGWTTDYRVFKNDNDADFSLVSSKIRSMHVSETSTSPASNQISLYNAGSYFGDKAWKGLDDTRTGDESVELCEGRKGVASHYESEAI
uniref:2-(3-amino-3-carboxypropyl)histidine synthase subunit 2 n=1 Tax=Syphacia muris TaxID=451379 RepID=A0A0N5AQL2_9BILA